MEVDDDLHIRAVQELKLAEGSLLSMDLLTMRESARRCIDLDPGLGRAWELLGLFQMISDDDLEAAAESFERSMGTRGHFQISILCSELTGSDQWPRGTDDQSRIARLQLMGNSFISDRMWNAAALCYLSIEERTEPNWMVFSVLGLIHREIGLLEPSLEYYDRSLEVRDHPHEIVHDRAIVLFKLGRFGEAEEAFIEVLESLPASPMVWNNLGSAQEAQGELGEAAISYMKAIDMDGEYYPALYSMGRILQRQGDMEGSRIFLEKAMDIEGRVFDIDDVTGREVREGDDDVHVKEIMTNKD